jgi:D-threo-aldose 1-dehydrogenase
VLQSGGPKAGPGKIRAPLSPLGFGGAPIGNLYRPVAEADARAAIQTALELGVRYFDTAPHYGFGLSERRLGEALAALDPQASAIISTKVGRLLAPLDDAPADGLRHGFAGAEPFEPVFDYSYGGVLRSFEQSCARLRRDRIDILLAHDLGRLTHGQDHPARMRQFLAGGYRAMCELRAAGAVGAIGLGVNETAVCEEVLAEVELDVILLAGRYTLLEQGALGSLLPRCASVGVQVVVGGPFNSGVLVETAAGPSHYDYAPAPAEVRTRVARLRDLCAAHGAPLAAAALQFPLAHPQVCAVIPGLASAEEAARAHAWINTDLPDGLWEALRDEGLLDLQAPTPEARVAV